MVCKGNRTSLNDYPGKKKNLIRLDCLLPGLTQNLKRVASALLERVCAGFHLQLHLSISKLHPSNTIHTHNWGSPLQASNNEVRPLQRTRSNNMSGKCSTRLSQSLQHAFPWYESVTVLQPQLQIKNAWIQQRKMVLKVLLNTSKQQGNPACGDVQ